MDNTKPISITQYSSTKYGVVRYCTLEVFHDGSAYVVGEGIEVIFEESPNAYINAVAYLENAGYRRC